MHLHTVLHGLVISAAAIYAFIPYVSPKFSTPMRAGVEGDNSWEKEWKPVKSVLNERDAEPFIPVAPVRATDIKELDSTKWTPVVPRDKSSDVVSLKLKKLPRADDAMHPEIRHVREANRITRKYRRRGFPGPEVDEHAAIREVMESLGKRDKAVEPRDSFLRSQQPSTPHSMAINQDGQDFSYFAEVQFGSQNKTFLVVIDTGSSDTWVPSANCGSPSCLVHKTFSDKDSSTTTPTGKQFRIKYGSGEVDGDVVTDDISFAGFRINVEFGVARVVSDDFLNFPIDGIMGLGFKEASQQQVKTIMDSLVEQGLIKNKLFAIALSRAQDGLNDGVLNFGGIDNSYYKGDLSFSTSVSKNGLWEIPVDDIGHDGLAFDFPKRTAVIDTGTSLILLPNSDALKFHAVVPGAQTNGQTFAVPCATNTTLEFTLGGVTYKIPSEDWVGQVINGKHNLCLSHLLGREILGPDVWLLGDVFLKNVYTVFDMDRYRVGFGLRKSATENNQPSETSLASDPSATGNTPSDIPSLTNPSSSGNKPTPKPTGKNKGSPFDSGGAAAADVMVGFGSTMIVSCVIALVMAL